MTAPSRRSKSRSERDRPASSRGHPISLTAAPLRVGFGIDVHRHTGGGGLRLCGVDIPSGPGLAGTSDADVGLHALIDAVLGAAALGDIGDLFPSSDPQWKDADSKDLVRMAIGVVHKAGYSVRNVDVTLVSDSVQVAPHRQAMRQVIAGLVDVDLSSVSVKATTADGLGLVGRGEGLVATAIATIQPISHASAS